MEYHTKPLSNKLLLYSKWRFQKRERTRGAQVHIFTMND